MFQIIAKQKSSQLQNHQLPKGYDPQIILSSLLWELFRFTLYAQEPTHGGISVMEFQTKTLDTNPIPSLWLKLNSWPCLLTNNNNALRMNSVKSDCKILVTVLGILLTILEYMYVRMPTVCSLLGWLLHELWTNVDNIIAPDCHLTTLMTTLCRGCISRSLDIDNWRALNTVVPYTLYYKISFDFNEYKIFTT